MKKTLSLVFVASTALLGACGKDDSCAEVAKHVCEEGKVDCDKTKGWIDEQMTGPDNKPLSGDDQQQVCKMLLDDKEALAGYTEQAKRDLGAAK